MGTISVSLPADGQTIDSSDVNTPINAILSEFNGNIDDANIKTGANINGSKILAASLPGSKLDTTTQGGWITGALPNVSSVTNNGQRSADVVFASTVASILTPGMRVRGTRTVTAPTQCADLEASSSQYFNDTSVAGMTFTDDFTVSAWVKLESYVDQIIASRFNGTSGWRFWVNSSGQITLQGFNAGAGNNSLVQTYQSLPLNRWIHIGAQLDMSAFTATTTTSYVMIDGVDVPCTVTRSGTNPTALVQAGNLEIGANNGGSNPFDGKLAQVAIFSAKVTQATMRAYMNQGLSGSETNLVSAYSFNNAITDLNTGNANNLTAQGGALATNADSPFGVDANGVPSGTYEWGIVTKVSTTTATIQFPEGSCFPTSGGVSTVDISPHKSPFGFPSQVGRWRVNYLLRVQTAVASNATFAAFAGMSFTVPTGDWSVAYDMGLYNITTTVVYWNLNNVSQAGLAASAADFTWQIATASPSAATYSIQAYVENPISLSSAGTFVMYTLGATTSAGALGSTKCELYAIPANL